MGHTATAKLFWGFPIDQDDDEAKAAVNLWEDKYAAAKGVKVPEGGYDREKYAAYLEKKLPLIKAAGCKVGHHGFEYGDDYVCVSASEVRSDWGEAIKLDSVYAVDPDWERLLKEFCAALGIAYQEPGWYLVAHYG